MKKLTIAVSLLLFTAISGKAQFFNNVGIKSGTSISNQHWNYKNSGLDYGNESRTGLYLGLTTEILKGKYFSLMADLGYIQKGMQFEVELTSETNPEGTGEFERVDNRYDFIGFQPNVKLHLPTEKFQPYILVGPRIDFYLGYYGDEYMSYFELSDLASVTFGATYGLGVDYNLKDFIISLEGLHQPDFTSFFDGRWLDAKNNAFAILLAVKYKLGE